MKKKYVILFIILLLQTTHLYSEEIIAKVRAVKGKAYYKYISEKTFKKLKANKKLKENVIIITKENSMVVLLLKKYGIIKLFSNSQILLSKSYISKLSDNIMLSRGKAVFSFAKLLKNKKINIFSPAIAVGVRGTKFEVATAMDSSVYVRLWQGKVELESEKSKTKLNPGEECAVSIENEEINKNPGTFEDWSADIEEKIKKNPVERLQLLENKINTSAKSQERLEKILIKLEKKEKSESTLYELERRFWQNKAKAEGIFLSSIQFTEKFKTNKKIQEIADRIKNIHKRFDEVTARIESRFARISERYEEKFKQIEERYEEKFNK